jgi:hypothetical protein
VAAAAIVWIGIASLTDTKPRHSTPAANASAPSAIPQVSPVSPLSTGSEYLLADQPALSSYQPRYGSRYNPLGYFGPADAKITHQRPGEYLVDFPGLADPHDSVEVSASDKSSICYSLESDGFSGDERVHVGCVRLVRVFPALTTPVDSRFTVAVIQPSRP